MTKNHMKNCSKEKIGKKSYWSEIARKNSSPKEKTAMINYSTRNNVLIKNDPLFPRKAITHHFFLRIISP